MDSQDEILLDSKHIELIILILVQSIQEHKTRLTLLEDNDIQTSGMKHQQSKGETIEALIDYVLFFYKLIIFFLVQNLNLKINS